MIETSPLRSKFTVLIASLVLLVAAGCGDSDADAPDLALDVDSEVTYTAGLDQVSITLTATDPQDEQLDFELVQGPDAASFRTQQNMGIFNWAPNAGDITDGDPHEVVFGVTNESGLTTERAVLIHIEGAGGMVFTSSSNQLYDPSSGEPLVFDVEVQHDEAADVDLTMPPEHAPEGAEFDQVDDYVGQFEWMPSPGQREQRNHRAVFRADDGAETVDQEVTIIVQSFDSGGVPGDEDTGDEVCEGGDGFLHHPVEAGHGPDDYQITGQLQDTSRDWQQAVLYWTYDDPLGAEEPEYFSESVQLDDTAFSFGLDNPLVDEGQAVDVSYAVCAFDGTDDEEGVICTPEEFYYRFVAYPPSEQKDTCRGDGIDMSTPQQAGEISTVAWEAYRSCWDEPNHHELQVEEGETVEVAVSYPVDREPEFQLEVDGDSVDLVQFDCIGLAYAEIDEPGTVRLRVSEEHFPYHVTGFVEGDDQTCPVEHDSTDDAIDVPPQFTSWEDAALCAEDDIDVYAFEAMTGDFMDALLEFDAGEGDLEMTLYGPDQHDEVGQATGGVTHAAGGLDGQAYLGHHADQSGTHYLSVHTDGQPAGYELMTELRCSADDEFEDNATLEDAALVDDKTYEDLRLCGGDSDWYGYIHEGTGDAWIEIRVHIREGTDMGVDLTVLDEDGEEIDGADDQGSDTSDTRESIVELEPDELVVFEVEAEEPLVYDLEVFESFM